MQVVQEIHGGKKRKKKQGTVLVSQGTYGCVYRPSLKCAADANSPALSPNESESGFLSKLQRDGRAARNEVVIGTKVAALPQYIQRFAPVVSSCPVAKTQVPKDAAFRKCKALKKGGDGDGELVLMTMPAAGKQTLAAYLDLHGGNALLAEMWAALSDSLTHLGTAGVVHFDLKDNNIMYARHAPVIIDFGLSIFVPDLLKEDAEGGEEERWRSAFFTYEPQYVPWCPEAALCAALWRGHETKGGGATGGSNARAPNDQLVQADVAELRAVVDVVFEQHPTFKALNGRRDLHAKRYRLYALADGVLGKTRVAAARAILAGSWHAWDRFALAGIFLARRPKKVEQDYSDFWNHVDADAMQ